MKILGPQRQPYCRPVGRRLSQVQEAVEYLFEHEGYRYKLVTPDSYLFDGASIPRICWTPLGLAPHGAMDGPSIPHDFIFEHQGDMPEGSYFIWNEYGEEWVLCTVPISKNTADLLLKALCIHFNATNIVQANLVYAGVTAFGWWAWMRNDTKRKDKVMDKLFEEESR